MPSFKRLIAKFNKKVVTPVPVEEFYYKGWSDVDQGSEPGWDAEEPSGSTGIKGDFEPFSMQVEQENPSLADLLDGKVRMEDFPLINVCLIEDVFYSLDNRRLYCFKKAIKRGLGVNRIPVRIRRVSDINIVWKMEGAYQVVRNTNFKEVVVSPSLRNGRVID
ncbi:24251_t:CDS:2, partial [Dentiscutata erythropus]